MSAENHANYAKIGLAVMLGVVATAVTLVYIAGVRNDADTMIVETYSDSSVNGLSVGSVVNFRGVKVGEVRRIDFIGNVYWNSAYEDWHKVYIEMALDARLLGCDAGSPESLAQMRQAVEERRGKLRAVVTSTGITGISRVELDFNGREEDMLPMSWKPEHPFIHPAPSLFDSFSVAATKAMNQLQRMDFGPVWSNVQVIAESLSHLAQDSREIIESRHDDIDGIIANANSISESLKDLSERLRDNPSLLLRENDPEPLPETDD